jgi:predicted nucleotidyltransferase
MYLNFDDFCFSNGTIVSYENSKYSNTVTTSIYDLYRKTNRYNGENKIKDNVYYISFSDGQKVGLGLPDDISDEYLTSSLLKDNDNSKSGGYITYNVQDIINGDKIVDYSKRRLH